MDDVSQRTLDLWDTLLPAERLRLLRTLRAWRCVGSDAHRPLEKITGGHRERLAIVYVRQSTPQQIERHQESTRLQYALVDRAVDLGWQHPSGVVVDDDLGRTGTTIEGRPRQARRATVPRPQGAAEFHRFRKPDHEIERRVRAGL
jgi:hypothetical protein